MSELELHTAVAWGVIALAVVVVVLLFFVVAPYGRHGRAGWGPTLHHRAAWILMESPAVVGFGAVYLAGDHALEPAPLAMLGLWMLHYVHRAWIYPFRVPASAKRMAVSVALMGASYQCVNSWLNARWISHLGDYPASWLGSAPFVAGAALFVLGVAINLHADAVLLNLRAPGESGYHIPHGGAYRWVSCPNYLGEIVAWVGWAVLTWSLAGASFAVFTIANLAPRAWAHHRWYQAQFPGYPAHRRALVPFLW